MPAKQIKWPNDAKIAVQFVLNYEEGGENCLLHGDAQSKDFYLKLSMRTMAKSAPLEYGSIYEYGAEAVLKFSIYLPNTIFPLYMELLQRWPSPEQVYAMQSANWEIASHGYKWIEHKDLTEEEEQIKKAIDLHTAVTGNPQKDGILEERP